MFYFFNNFSISVIGSDFPFENKLNPSLSFKMTGRPNTKISTILIGAEAQTSAMLRPQEEIEWQTLAHLTTLTL